MSARRPRITDRRQDDAWSCGAVCAALALEAAGWEADAASAVVATSLTSTPIDGTDPRTLESFLRRAGCRVQAGEMDLEDLSHHTARGRPVVCLVQSAAVGHWVTVLGVSRRRVTYHCSIYGPQWIPPRDFSLRWWDTDRHGVRYRGFGVVAWKPKGL